MKKDWKTLQSKEGNVTTHIVTVKNMIKCLGMNITSAAILFVQVTISGISEQDYHSGVAEEVQLLLRCLQHKALFHIPSGRRMVLCGHTFTHFSSTCQVYL